MKQNGDKSGVYVFDAKVRYTMCGNKITLPLNIRKGRLMVVTCWYGVMCRYDFMKSVRATSVWHATPLSPTSSRFLLIQVWLFQTSRLTSIIYCVRGWRFACLQCPYCHICMIRRITCQVSRIRWINVILWVWQSSLHIEYITHIIIIQAVRPT